MSGDVEHERSLIPDSPYYKPGVKDRIEEQSVLTDVAHAIVAKDEDKVKELVQERRLHTYDIELEKRDINRSSDQYRYAFEYAISWLYEHRPFYAYMFDEIVRRRTMLIDTLCVVIRQGRIEFWYNPDFLAIHTLKQNVGFLQHEMGHIAQNHLPMQKRLPKKVIQDPVFGLAIDLSVDTLIQAVGDQPPWVLLPSMLRVPEEGVPEEEWKSFKERGLWEYYFRLLKDMRENEQEQFQKQVMQIVMQRPGSGKPGDGG